MIAVDTNLLVYAHRKDCPWNEAAHGALRSLATGSRSWAIPWPSVHEFFAVVTHPRIYSPPSSTEQAVAQVDAWFEDPKLVLLSEDGSHWAQLRALLLGARVSGPLVHDARIAALCLAHGVTELWSADRDFSRFPQLKTRNILIRSSP